MLFCKNKTKAHTIIIPIPYEKTTSYMKGCKRGPKAVINAIPYQEEFEDELLTEIYKIGIYINKPLKNEKQINRFFFNYNLKKFHIFLGGEHTITYFIIQNLIKIYNYNMDIIHIDAHTDLRNEYENSKINHATTIKRIYDLGKTNIFSIGIRSFSEEEYNLFKNNNRLNIFFARDIIKKGYEQVLHTINKKHKKGTPIYLTIDIDGFDPSIFPGTGTPEPGGLLWYETLDFIKHLFTQYNIIATDIVEIMPLKNNIITEYNVARLLYKIIGYKYLLYNK